MRTKLACIPLFIGACLLLYFGSSMLLFFPYYSGASHLKFLLVNKLLYGVLPATISVGLLILVAWLWDKSSGSGNFPKAINRSISLAIAAIFFFGLCVTVLKRFYP